MMNHSMIRNKIESLFRWRFLKSTLINSQDPSNMVHDTSGQDISEPRQDEDQDIESSQFEKDEDDSDVDSSLWNQPNPDRYSVARDRQSRNCRPPQRYGYFDLVAYALTSVAETIGEKPLTYEEAVSSKDANKWQEAMRSKIASLKKNNT